jgi:hypothetical protein
MKILVVGAGIAGSSFARFATDAGAVVTVVADSGRPAASAAALCVTRPGWFTGTDRVDCEWTLDWYRNHGWLTDGSATYGSYRTNRTETRTGYYAIDPVSPLVVPDVIDDWRNLRDDYDLRVLARGAYGDGDGHRVHGATAIVAGCGRPPVAAYHDRPRSVMFAVSHDGRTVRTGSSKAPNREQAILRQQRDYEKAVMLGLVDLGDASMVTGVRLMPSPASTPGTPRWLDRRTVAVEGFGRVGYSLAPARMAALVDEVTG